MYLECSLLPCRALYLFLLIFPLNEDSLPMKIENDFCILKYLSFWHLE